MRAVVVEQFGPVENAELRDVPEPAVKPGELLVEVHATAASPTPPEAPSTRIVSPGL